MTFYVKKICSLHPTRYKYISLPIALAEYREYCMYWEKAHYDDIELKTFDKWLKTEI